MKKTWEEFLKALGCKPYEVAMFEQMHDAIRAKELADRVKQIEKVKEHEH